MLNRLAEDNYKKVINMAENRESYISKAPIRRLMKQQGARLVAEEAVICLIDKLTEIGKDVTKKAIKIVEGEKRKRITPEDIREAQKA